MIDTAILTAGAALFGAMAGGTITWAIARKNLKKEISLKMAEYRIQWMNNLGKEFAEFSANATTTLHFSRKELNEDLYKSVMRSRANILMLMNVKDADYIRLKDAMDALIVHAGNFVDEEIQREHIRELYRLNHEFMTVCNNILKREWNKTKRHLRVDTVDVAALHSESTPDNVSYYLYHRP